MREGGIRREQTPAQQTIIQTVNIRRRPGCLGGCAGVICIVIVLAIIGAAMGGKGVTTVTPAAATPVMSGVVSTALVATSTIAAPAPTRPASTVPPTVSPQVVTVIDNAVSVREAGSMDAQVVASLDTGTELSVLGPDTTGPDSKTRWVHVSANGRDGYVRSDLVSAPRAYVALTMTPQTTRLEATPHATATIGATRQAQLSDLYDFMFNVGCNLDGGNGVGYPVPSYCPHLKKVGLNDRGAEGDEAYALTDLSVTATGVPQAHEICLGLYRWALNFDQSVKIITVLDAKQMVIATAIFGGKSCEG